MADAVGRLAEKIRRALLNGTGAQLSLEELRQLADLGAFEIVLRAEGEEIRGGWLGSRQAGRGR